MKTGGVETIEFVFDNSIVMSWCFKDEINSYSDFILDSMESCSVIVPSIWPLEVGNVLLVAERKKSLTEADSSRFLDLLSDLPIFVEQKSPERMVKEIFALARRLDLSSYDASYLDLAMKKGLPITSLDKNLIRASKKVKVPVFQV